MTPVIPCSSGSVTLLTKATFSQRRDIKLTKYKVSPSSSRALFSNKRFLLPRSVSLRLLQKQLSDYSSKYVYRAQFLAAVGTDVATEEPNPAISAEQVDASPESLPSSTETETDESSVVSSTTPAAQSKRTRPARRSDMPPVKNEELLPGASFTGKVRSIQPFGAFVDFGAFTDGLVHVSKLSDEFVKDVGNVVSVGEEVKVRIVEANIETGRISLTMRDSDDVSKLQQRREASSGGSDRPRTGKKNAGRSNQRRGEAQRTSKFLKGQVLDGTVKNLTRSGAYVSLPDGEEGFLPLSEESEFGNLLGSSTLQVGQEVNVRVLRISRGQTTLTMKKEEEVEAINIKLNQGVVHAATNPFVLAFRQNKDIAAFLDEREKAQESAEDSSEEEVDEKLPKESNQLELQNSATTSDSEVITIPTSVNKPEENIVPDLGSSKTVIDEGGSEILTSEENASIPEAFQQIETEKSDFSTQLAKDDQNDDMNSGSLISQETDSSSDSFAPEASVAIEVEEADTPADTVLDDDSASSLTNLTLDATSETNVENEIAPATEIAHEVEASDGSLISEGISAADSVADATLTADNSVEIISGVEASVEDVVSEEAVTSQADSSLVDENVENEAPADVIASESPDMGVTDDAASNVQSAPVQENSATASISPALVKRLREETGAGMMDCKKALAETGGDIDKAQEFLRKKGLAGADKKASRATAEGRIGSYIHDNRIGVLIEVNCETDFVSRGDIFKELVDDLAMQVAACPQVQYLVTEDVPEEIVTKERELEMQKEDLLTKPEQIQSKIVDGRIRKRLEEFALLEQSYIKNDKMVVKDFVKQTIATIGENIKVKRFVRYNLGEGLQKKSPDFAAEVAAQTAAKEPPAVPKDQPSESGEPIEKPPVVAVSATLVKELREETGAGMMDCKKALTESGGDLEKAQEYLRKKGLSSADKKSSRLAAEGRIATYIHDNRIGVLVEVNSETDFVARNERFKQLVDDLAMQVVACPQVEFVSMEEIPESVLSKEKEMEMQREDLQSKPENIREKIVEGRVSKRLGELALLEQPFIKDDSLMVKDLVKQTVAALGENIRVRRFVRFTLGE